MIVRLTARAAAFTALLWANDLFLRCFFSVELMLSSLFCCRLGMCAKEAHRSLRGARHPHLLLPLWIAVLTFPFSAFWVLILLSAAGPASLRAARCGRGTQGVIAASRLFRAAYRPSPTRPASVPLLGNYLPFSQVPWSPSPEPPWDFLQLVCSHFS